MSARKVLPVCLVVVILFISISLIFLSACRTSEKPAELSQSASLTPPPAALSPWDELVKAAQKEGTVNIYGTAVAPAVTPLRQAFKQRFGIALEFVEGRPPEVLAKINTERRAGLYLADVGHLGETTSTMDIKPLGITISLDSLLISPEVKSPDSWLGGKLPFLDKEHSIFMFMAMGIPMGVSNSDLVKEGEISSFLDILKPQWKKKIVFSDPSVSGTSPNALASLVKIFGRERALSLFKELAAQEPVITRDQRLLLDWVAQGKYPIGLGGSLTLFSEFRRAGAPVRFLNFKEPKFISGGPGSLMVFSRNPHPKATQLYVNWLLGKEGSTIWSKSVEYPSMRVDVPKEHLNPETLPRSEYIFPDEEQMQLRLEMRKTAAEIFGPLMR